jgi:RHS repeat-associated protein
MLCLVKGEKESRLPRFARNDRRRATVIGSGAHTLKWRYVKDGSGTSGDDCAWVDWVQWEGSVAEPDPNAWATQVHYVYDAVGRRIAKWCDGRLVLKYLYDGDHCIAEYGAGNDLHRKYVYGPGVDQPICLIEAAGSYAGTYYYHFDGLGSVVALTNAGGNTVQVYDYSVYGRVGATDASHPNRLMFTAREFDKETGLYYYRARYYNAEIGRFLQPDPVRYDAGMNLYRYCQNNATNFTDPYGLKCYRSHLEVDTDLEIRTNWGCWPGTQQALQLLFGGSHHYSLDTNEANCPSGQHCEWGWRINVESAEVDMNDVAVPGWLIKLLMPVPPPVPLILIPDGCVITITGSVRMRGWYQLGKCVPDSSDSNSPGGGKSNSGESASTPGATAQAGLNIRENLASCSG